MSVFFPTKTFNNILDKTGVLKKHERITKTLFSGQLSNATGDSWDVSGYSAVQIKVSGTFDASIRVDLLYSFPGQSDTIIYPNGDRYAIISKVGSQKFLQRSITEPGMYTIDVSGISKIIPYVFDYNSGSVDVFASASIDGSIKPRPEKWVDGIHYPEISAVTKQQEVAASIYERIIDEIGLENIKMFVPAWEESPTELRDIINRGLVFKKEGGSLTNSQGLLHRVPLFTGNGSGFYQQPTISQEVTGGAVALNTTNTKLAQKITGESSVLSLIRLSLKTVGSLPSATLKIGFYTDSSGPDSLIAESEARSVPGSNFGMIGFSLDSAIRANHARWIVLEFDNATGVDGSNYVEWEHDNGDNSYGQDRAVFSVSWSVNPNENHVFKIYDDALTTPDDWTIIASARSTLTLFGSRELIRIFDGGIGFWSIKSNGELWVYAQSDNWTNFGIFPRISLAQLQENNVFGMSFSKDASTYKLKAYFNGRLYGKADGAPGDGYPRQDLSPVVLAPNYSGALGPWIVTSNIVPESTMAKVANLMGTIRRLSYGQV